MRGSDLPVYRLAAANHQHICLLKAGPSTPGGTQGNHVTNDLAT
jgi:hypothetical protein